MKNSDYDDLDQALIRGELCVLPTETVYGLAAKADNATAISQIYKVKGRGFDKPLAVCVRDLKQANSFAEFSATARQLATDFWPGPLTLVLNAKINTLHPQLYGTNPSGEKTIALRCPNIEWRERLTALPIALTSANRSGQPAAETAKSAMSTLAPDVKHVLDGGPSASGQASMIIALDGRTAKILRDGELTPEDFAPYDLDWML